MPDTDQPIWELVQECARELDRAGVVPFKRSDLIECVQRKRPGCPENSINPVIQGVTINLKGGAPGAVDKEILFNVGLGLFVLNSKKSMYVTNPAKRERSDTQNAQIANKNEPGGAHVAGSADSNALSEDEVKQKLANWFESNGWDVEVAWGKVRGIDIQARRAEERWIIEVKGCGSRDAMRVNYFLAVLGETLQRMDDPTAQYFIAFPDLPQFRRLWDRLPTLAKDRTKIGALFVDRTGAVEVLGSA